MTYKILTEADIARACHEANRVIQGALGEEVSPPWDDATPEQRMSTREGVYSALEGKGPEDLHDLWMDRKISLGWTLGEAKDEEAKTHPCLVPYMDLPQQQRIKDAVFMDTVLGLREFLIGYEEPETMDFDLSTKPLEHLDDPTVEPIDVRVKVTYPAGYGFTALNLLRRMPGDERMPSLVMALCERGDAESIRRYEEHKANCTGGHEHE